MTNYNDGSWHGWNGGECPVHPKSEVEIVSIEGGTRRTNRVQCVADDLLWKNPMVDILAFRVTKEHKESREFWVVLSNSDLPVGVWDSLTEASNAYDQRCGGKIIHVREVIDGETT